MDEQKFNPVLIKASKQHMNNKDENFPVSKDTVKKVLDETYIIKNERSLDSIFGNGTGDWPEDLKFENGNYSCKCSVCKQIFMGNKHRVVCKKCAVEEITINKQEYERLLDIEKKYEEWNKWYWDRPLGGSK